MKESFIDGDRAVVANDQPAEVAEPSEGAFHLPTTPVSTQRSAILRARLAAIPAMRCHQGDSACRQPLAQRIAVIGAIRNHTRWFLAWPSARCRRVTRIDASVSSASRTSLGEAE